MANLSNWILQSESWHKFKQFRLTEESMSNYDFLGRYDDFYISLVGKLDDLLNSSDFTEEYILGIARGLEIYGLKETKDSFTTISGFDSLLYASSLYYIINKTSISGILASYLSETESISNIDEFILCFLSRKVKDTDNQYLKILYEFINTGDSFRLSCLISLLNLDLKKATSMNYFSIKIAQYLINKFYYDNVWQDLSLSLSEDSSGRWNKYLNNLIKSKIWTQHPRVQRFLY